jgi:hypothetical protein
VALGIVAVRSLQKSTQRVVASKSSNETEISHGYRFTTIRRECVSLEQVNRSREAGNRDEVEGVRVSTLGLLRNGVVGFRWVRFSTRVLV